MRNGFDPTTPGAEHSKLDPATFVKKADIEPALKVVCRPDTLKLSQKRTQIRAR